MSWLRPVAAAFAVVAFGGCSSGGGAPNTVPAPVLPPTPAPGADRIGYAVLTGSRTTPIVLTVYSTSGSALRSAYGLGALATFDARGNLYTTGAANVSTFSMGVDRVPRLIRTLTTPLEPCWVAADASGRVYVATCLAGRTPFTPTLGPVSMYPPDGNDPTATNSVATGPLAVDGSGNLYAVYNGAVGVWSAGAFGSTPPARTLPAGPTGAIRSIAVDRAGTTYVVVRPTPATYTTTSTLYSVAAGAATTVTVQTGFIGEVATPPK